MQVLTKEQIIARLREIKQMGWIPNARHGNHGGIGNTLEDLLGIAENNLPIPNAAEWELKCQRRKHTRANARTTLFHWEPSPKALKFVPAVFLPLYGWPHQTKPDERSFRQTINALHRSDRGFQVVVDRAERKILVSFDPTAVAPRHMGWLVSVAERVRLGELNPQPYWGFDDLFHKAGMKLKNCFYVLAQVKQVDGQEFFLYDNVLILKDFRFEKFLAAVEKGWILIDFDARTGHNHGTKFRLRQDKMPELYETAEMVA
jgi:hypothetical protein